MNDVPFKLWSASENGAEAEAERLLAEAAEHGDARVRCIGIRPLAMLAVRAPGRRGGGFANWAHWAMIVAGVDAAATEHVFLHDADAFFAEKLLPRKVDALDIDLFKPPA